MKATILAARHDRGRYTARWLIATVATATMVLAACGTDDNFGSVASVSEPGPGTSPSSSSDALGEPESEAAGFTCATGTLRSSGSTAQGKVMAELIASYNATCGATIGDYGGGGSGQGITDFLAGQTDFGGSDSAMTPDELARAKNERCEAADAVNLPMVTGPIAIAFHLAEITQLTLTPEVLSAMFGGQITQWDDPAITSLNPDVVFPDLAITTVHRAEDSGTTDNFTKYLTAAGGWSFDGGKAWTAPGGTGAQGSDGVAKAVAGTEGAIGYVEWGFATDAKLSMADIDNGSGPVALTAASAGKAVEAAEIVGTGADLALQLDYATSEPGAYPIILVTYELICTGGNGDNTALLRSFLGYAATEGQGLFADLGAAPLPESIRARVEATIAAIA